MFPGDNLVKAVSVGRICHLEEGILCSWESSHENRLAWLVAMSEGLGLILFR